MALTRYGADYAFGIPENTQVDGIESLTSVEVSGDFETDVTAKDEGGEVAAHLVGNSKFNFRAEGYTSAANMPALGGKISIQGKTGIITRVNIVSSNEDFVKVSVEGSGFTGINYA